MIKTSHKIFIARLLSATINAVRILLGKSDKDKAVVKRRGIRWSLDLNEGIDFSIYLIGGFEPRTLRLYQKIVKPGQTVLDIGANVGSHTLPLAKLVGKSGRVVAFEPTYYAYGKLILNIALNPELSPRIVPRQAMLVADSQARLEPALFSSWPLENSSDLHEVHKGRLMDTSGAFVETLDDAVDRLELSRIDFLKIDVDGYEHHVLKGGLRTLKIHKPSIIVEFAPYLIKSEEFCDMVELLLGLGYRFHDANSLRQLPGNAHALKALIPCISSLNIYCSRHGAISPLK
ncbi:MAG: FkbM family methyltransferase [Desulfatirhabdiaceae bacterium]